MTRTKYSNEMISKVFGAANKINGEDPNLWRKDHMGKTIYRPAYEDIHSPYGWNIHHKDGKPDNNNLSNLLAVNYDSHTELH